MCHSPNTHGTQPYVTLNNLHVAGCRRRGELFCGEGGKPDPNQSNRSVWPACRQPRFLKRLPQLLCTHLPGLLISQPGRRQRRRRRRETWCTSIFKALFPFTSQCGWSHTGLTLSPLHLSMGLGHCSDLLTF